MHKLMKVPPLDRRGKARTIHVFCLIILTFLHAEGIIAISTGIWLIARLKRTSCEFFDQFVAAGVFWLVSGFLCIVVSIPGVLMTFRHRQYLRPPYFIGGFIIIIILEITVAIVATLDYKNLTNKFQGQLSESLLVAKYQECWGNIQADFECCGVTSHQNWISNTKQNISAATTAWGLSSCKCTEDIEDCVNVSNSVTVNLTSPFIWPTSCYQKLYSHVKLQCNFLRIFCPLVAISQFIACTFLGYVFKKLMLNNAVQIAQKKYTVQFSSQATLCDNSKTGRNCSQNRNSLHM